MKWSPVVTTIIYTKHQYEYYAMLTMIPWGPCKQICSHRSHPACQPSTHLANQMRILLAAYTQ